MARTLLFLACVALPLTAAAGKKPRPKDVAQAELRMPEGTGDFTFGAGDRLTIKVYKHDDLSSELAIAPDGTITVPLLGRVDAAGQTYEQLVHELEAGWREYYTDASVAVNVAEVSNQKLIVVGEVMQPQVMQITGEMTVIEAITRAGGVTPDAKTRNVLLVRGSMEQPELYAVDLNALMRGELAQNAQLVAGDILVVPTATIANVERFFRRISGILGPFVSGSQIYRNVRLQQGQQVVVDDNPSQP